METTKHAGGRPPKFKTPEELQEKAEGYFLYCDTHPIEVWQRKAAAATRWTLSDRERAIIAKLSKKDSHANE